jgi:hypothetical protein
MINSSSIVNRDVVGTKERWKERLGSGNGKEREIKN